MTTNEMIEVMQSHMNGAGIQERPNWDQEEEAWKDVQSPKWNWETTEYRICPSKPAMTAEDLLIQMKEIEGKYDKIFKSYDELVQRIWDNKRAREKSFVKALLRVCRKETQDLEDDMEEDMRYLFLRHQKLSLEASLLYLNEI